jgi:hypothetical protein
MGHARAEAVDEFVEHELAVEEDVGVVVNLFGHLVEELDLDLGERFGGLAAALRELRIGLLPLGQFLLTLLVVRAEEVDQFFHQFVLTVLRGENLPEQDRMFVAVAMDLLALGGSGGRDIHLREERRDGIWIRHRGTGPFGLRGHTIQVAGTLHRRVSRFASGRGDLNERAESFTDSNRNYQRIHYPEPRRSWPKPLKVGRGIARCCVCAAETIQPDKLERVGKT